MTEIRIEKVKHSDMTTNNIKSIINMYNNSFPKHCVRNFEDLAGKYKNPCWILIFWYSRLIGMCTVGEDDMYYYLYNLVVQKFQRKKGIGKYILNQIRSNFYIKPIYFHTHKTNYDAILFYSKCGAKWIENNKNLNLERSGYVLYELV
jgi:ribosomal protein S18 acetylase RimI-like enzyme